LLYWIEYEHRTAAFFNAMTTFVVFCFEFGTYFDRPWAQKHRLFDVPLLDYRVDNWRSKRCEQVAGRPRI
jgi:hypothetical protein